jgi:hypothetical protein
MITKINYHKIKCQSNIEMLKKVMKKKKVKLSVLFYETFFFLEYEKKIYERKVSLVEKKRREKTLRQTHFGFVIFFLKKKH